MNDSEIFITGANGQLGTALKQRYPGARSADIDELDITKRESVQKFDWTGIKVIINAAAYTNVDSAETAEGRVTAWQVNAQAVGNLLPLGWRDKIKTIHVSTDYVFDGSVKNHNETENFSPLSVYGASKAAGDLLVSQLSGHYILRTSWVIGEGKNFVRTMLELGQKGVDPTVVSDQMGRLTFTSELVRAIDHLLTKDCPPGTYNLTNDGEVVSWADIARKIYELAGLENKVTNISTADYYKDKPEAAPRPLNSDLNLSKIKATGFQPKDWQVDLTEYINNELRHHQMNDVQGAVEE